MSDKHDKQLGLFDDCSPIIRTPKSSSQWTLYIDGASRRNPGPAGAGVYILKDKEPFFKKGFFLGNKTNNQAEYLALVLGLYYTKKDMQVHDTLHVMSDSELLVRQMKGQYRVKNSELKQLFDLSQVLIKDVHHSFCHILREYNGEADKLANHGIDSKTLPPQTFFSLLHKHEIHI